MYDPRSYALGSNRSCIRELFEYGKSRAQAVGEENVFDFSLGNPSIPTPTAVEAALQALLAEMPPAQLHGYTSAVGDEATRQAIARDLNERFHTDITPQELFIGCGAAPELCAAFRAVTFPGAKILAICPYFPEYKPFVEAAGAVFEAVPADIPGFQLPLKALEAHLTENTAAVIINSPNNPSGAVYTEENLLALSRLLEEKSRQFGRPIYIISDEPYRELVYGDVEAPFIPKLYPNTVVCYSYSKSLSLPGERIGYIYVPRQAKDGQALYLAIAGAARAMGHVCAPSLWQKVIARCAGVRPELQVYDQNRRALYEGLLAAGYTAARPDGAFYLFVQAPGGDAVAFSEFAKKFDILLVPGDGFGCPGWFRLCYCLRYEKIVRSLPVFDRLLKAWKER